MQECQSGCARRIDGEQDTDKCKYRLNGNLWHQVQIDDWSEYTDDDRTFLRVRKQRASEEAAPDAAGKGSRSPEVKEAAVQHNTKEKKESGRSGGGAVPDEAARGVALRAGGSEGSAFQDVKAAKRAGPAAVARESKASPIGQSPANEKTGKGADAEKASRVPSAVQNKSTSPVQGRQETGSKAGIPRKRKRETSGEAPDDALKTDTKADAAKAADSRSAEGKSDTRASDAPYAPPPVDKDKDREREREGGRERVREADRDTETQRRADCNLSPGKSLAGAAFLSRLSLSVACIT